MGACQDGDAAITEGGCDAAAIRMPRGCAAHGVVQAQAGEGREAAALARPRAHAAVAAAGRQQLAAVRLRAEAEDVARLPALGYAPCSGIDACHPMVALSPIKGTAIQPIKRGYMSTCGKHREEERLPHISSRGHWQLSSQCCCDCRMEAGAAGGCRASV